MERNVGARGTGEADAEDLRALRGPPSEVDGRRRLVGNEGDEEGSAGLSLVLLHALAVGEGVRDEEEGEEDVVEEGLGGGDAHPALCQQLTEHAGAGDQQRQQLTTEEEAEQWSAADGVRRIGR